MSSKNINKMNVKELKSKCRSLGIRKFSKLRKNEIIQLINNHNQNEEKQEGKTLESMNIKELKNECWKLKMVGYSLISKREELVIIINACKNKLNLKEIDDIDYFGILNYIYNDFGISRIKTLKEIIKQNNSKFYFPEYQYTKCLSKKTKEKYNYIIHLFWNVMVYSNQGVNEIIPNELERYILDNNSYTKESRKKAELQLKSVKENLNRTENYKQLPYKNIKKCWEILKTEEIDYIEMVGLDNNLNDFRRFKEDILPELNKFYIIIDIIDENNCEDKKFNKQITLVLIKEVIDEVEKNIIINLHNKMIECEGALRILEERIKKLSEEMIIRKKESVDKTTKEILPKELVNLIYDFVVDGDEYDFTVH